MGSYRFSRSEYVGWFMKLIGHEAALKHNASSLFCIEAVFWSEAATLMLIKCENIFLRSFQCVRNVFKNIWITYSKRVTCYLKMFWSNWMLFGNFILVTMFFYFQSRSDCCYSLCWHGSTPNSLMISTEHYK